MTLKITLKFLLCASLFGTLFLGCKEDSDIGSELLSDGDLFSTSFSDTFAIKTYTVALDSLNTTKQPQVVLGKIYDSEFGITKASLFTEMSLKNPGAGFGSNPLIDSVVFNLPITETAGSADQLNFRIAQLDAELIESTYFSSDTAAYGSSLIDFVYPPNITIGSDLDVEKAGNMKQNLSNSFGQSILDLTSTETETNDAFKTATGGLAIVPFNNSPNSGEGSLFAFDLSEATITLHYHNDADDSLSSTINFSAANYFNNYSHDHSITTGLNNQLNDSTLGDESIYVQPLAGTEVIIEFPNIKNILNEGNISLNKAEIVFPNSFPNDPVYGQSSAIELLVKHEDGTYTSIDDAANLAYSSTINPTTSINNGGSYNDETGVYTLMISEYLQQVLKGSHDATQLVLRVHNDEFSLKRVILNGPKALAKEPIKLSVYYSVYE